MDGMNANTKESRKKFLVPLVVLLLCAVSLMGAAYAYGNSTVTVIDNKVAANEYVLELYDKEGSLISDSISVDALRVYSETEIGGTPNTVVVKAETYSTNTYTGKLTLKDSTVTGTSAVRNITAGAVATDGTNMTVSDSELSVTPAVDIDGEIGYTVAVALYLSDEDGNKTNTLYNPANAIAFKNGVATLWYVVTVEATEVSTTTGITFENNTPQEDVNEVLRQLGVETFKLTFTAVAPAA